MDRDEVLRTVQVDEDKIVCKTCRYKNSGQEYPHYTKAHCGVYREGIKTKPNSVLFKNGDCEFYKHE